MQNTIEFNIVINKLLEYFPEVGEFHDAVAGDSVDDSNDFSQWLEQQEPNMGGARGWIRKFQEKRLNAKKNTHEFLLKIEDYLFKAYEASLNHPSQVGNANSQYNLSRIGDEGGYTVESCRFLTKEENVNERDSHTDYSIIFSNIHEANNILASLDREFGVIIFNTESLVSSLVTKYSISKDVIQIINNINSKRLFDKAKQETNWPCTVANIWYSDLDYKIIAKEFNVTEVTIKNIKSSRSWNSITSVLPITYEEYLSAGVKCNV